jgi:hypothetical protein
MVTSPFHLTWRKRVSSTEVFPSNLSVILINNKVLWTSSQILPLKESYNLFFKDQRVLCYILPASSADISELSCLVSKISGKLCSLQGCGTVYCSAKVTTFRMILTEIFLHEDGERRILRNVTFLLYYTVSRPQKT